jgi:hypothetical protein
MPARDRCHEQVKTALIVFDAENEEIRQWTPQPPTAN